MTDRASMVMDKQLVGAVLALAVTVEAAASPDDGEEVARRTVDDRFEWCQRRVRTR